MEGKLRIGLREGEHHARKMEGMSRSQECLRARIREAPREHQFHGFSQVIVQHRKEAKEGPRRLRQGFAGLAKGAFRRPAEILPVQVARETQQGGSG